MPSSLSSPQSTAIVIGPRSNYNQCFRLLNADDADWADLFYVNQRKSVPSVSSAFQLNCFKLTLIRVVIKRKRKFETINDNQCFWCGDNFCVFTHFLSAATLISQLGRICNQTAMIISICNAKTIVRTSSLRMSPYACNNKKGYELVRALLRDRFTPLKSCGDSS